MARGNLKVFEEIGLEFARYLHECPPDAPADSPAVQRFLDGLRPGDPPEGQGYLRQAFARYERRRLERDPKERAELAVLANLEIGFHEQTRLQPEIREALDAAYATQEELGGARSRRSSRRRRAGGPSSGARPRPSPASWRQACSEARAGLRAR